jgi:hypothetical protein
MHAKPGWPGCRKWVYCRIVIELYLCRNGLVCKIATAIHACMIIILRMSTPTRKRLSDIRNDFERGVFLSVYNSRTQRMRRHIARIILGLKHGLRGTLFSWPLYLLPLAAWYFRPTFLPLILLLLIPGVYISGLILLRGVREDYANHVEGFILRPGYSGRLLFPANFVT